MPKEKRPLSSDSGSGSGSGSSSGSGSDSDCSRSPSPPPAKKPKGKTYDNKTFGNSSKPRQEFKSKQPEKPKQSASSKKSNLSAHSSVVMDTDNEGNPMWQIGPMKKVTVRKFKGSVYIDVREYYSKDGKDMPGKKGISMKPDQWHLLKSLGDEIDDAILRA